MDKIPKKLKIVVDSFETRSSKDKKTIIEILGPYVRGDISYRDAYRLLIKNGIILGVLGAKVDDFNEACDKEIKKYIRNRIPELAQWLPDDNTFPQPIKSRGDVMHRAVPEVKVDNVHFTATSIKAVLTGKWFRVDIWAHLGSDRGEVRKRAREQYNRSDVASGARGPIKMTRNTLMAIFLEIEGATVENPEEMLLWDGEISNVTFRAKTGLDTGTLHGLATVRLEGLQIARIYFDIAIGKDGDATDDLRNREEIHKKAFVSYASQDRKKVMARIQGIKKIAPYLDIFMDVLSLRSGVLWEQELWKVIPENDVFYLFWSEHASHSPWVEKEWKCALQVRGLGFIDPIPLVSPKKAPPPPELAKKHFNDPLLPYINEEDGAG